MDQALSDWTKALSIAQEQGLRAAELWHKTVFVIPAGDPEFLSYQAFHVRRVLKPEIEDRYCRVVVNPRIQDFYEVERIEIYLSVITQVWAWITADYPGIDALALRLGAARTLDLSPTERWRVLAIQQPIATLPYIHLDHRPTCAVCSIRVATGRQSKSTQLACHHECYEFMNLVVKPALMARRAALAAAQAHTAEALSDEG